MVVMRMTTGERLRKIRKAKKLTQTQLAEMAGIKQETISAIENGRNLPTMASVRLLANALNCQISDLMEGDDEKTEQKNKSLTHDELRLLNLYGLLNESGKQFLMQTALNLVQTPELRQDGSIASMA